MHCRNNKMQKSINGKIKPSLVNVRRIFLKKLRLNDEAAFSI